MKEQRGGASVSGQREQPSRPAGGELPHRDSSCLLLLRCGDHFWLTGVCHIAEFNPLLFFLSVVCLSRYILFKVRMSEAYERSSADTPLL
eukprot:superscaffoldBa00004929_g19652